MASTSTHVPKERDLSAHCRVCLQLPEEDQVLDVNLIYDEEEQLSYYNCFVICTQIDLDDGVGMPHNLCKLCGIELQMAYDFYKKVDTARRCLQEMEDNACKEDLAEMDGFQTVEQCDKLIIEDPEVLEDDMTSEAAEEAQDTLSPDAQDTLSPDAQDALSQDVQDAEEKLIEHDNYMEIEDFDSIEGLEEREEEAEVKQTELETPHYKTEFETFVLGKPEDESPSIITEVDPGLLNAGLFDEDSLSGSNEQLEETEEESKDEAKEEAPGKKYYFYERRKGSKAKDKIVRKRFVGPHSCDYCKKVFKNHSRMMLHRRSHELDRPKYPCDNCSRIYATKQAKEVHVRTVHSKAGYSCTVCQKIFAIHKSLEVHMRYHTGDFPFKCDQCDKKFAQISHLNTHEKVKHNSVRFMCEYPECGKLFTSSTSLRNHEFSHTAMPFECTFCGRGYPAKSKLKVHLRRAHGKAMTLDEMEPMRRFHVMRSKLSLVQVLSSED